MDKTVNLVSFAVYWLLLCFTLFWPKKQWVQSDTYPPPPLFLPLLSLSFFSSSPSLFTPPPPLFLLLLPLSFYHSSPSLYIPLLPQSLHTPPLTLYIPLLSHSLYPSPSSLFPPSLLLFKFAIFPSIVNILYPSCFGRFISPHPTLHISYFFFIFFNFILLSSPTLPIIQPPPFPPHHHPNPYFLPNFLPQTVTLQAPLFIFSAAHFFFLCPLSSPSLCILSPISLRYLELCEMKSYFTMGRKRGN